MKKTIPQSDVTGILGGSYSAHQKRYGVCRESEENAESDQGFFRPS
jgi:hypothetical protein